MSKYRVEMGRDLFSLLSDRGLLEYGSLIPAEMIRKFLDIEVPTVGTKQQFNEAALMELKAVDYVRNSLLDHGKYVASTGDSYRILLPSENAHQCEKYISAATKKLNRSLKLSRNTPAGDHPGTDQQTVRAIMRKEGIRKKF